MSNNNTHDAVVIGTGQAGKPLAVSLAKAGWKTAVIERDAVGGSCINVGCTPTKTMVASARVAHLTRRGADYGVITGPLTMDLGRVRQRKQGVVTSFRTGSEKGPGANQGSGTGSGRGAFRRTQFDRSDDTGW